MARHVPNRFRDKLDAVQAAVDAAADEAPRHFDYGADAVPGVRLVHTEARGLPIVFSLWTLATDVAELCGDAAVPATTGLLAIDAGQTKRLKQAGVFIDLSQFIRSDSTPGVYYVLFDHLSASKVHDAMHRLVPSLEPHDGRTLTA